VNIYVGNLSFEATEEDLQGAFESFGKVESAKIIRDKYSGQSRGFGFVEMPSSDEARAAISGLNGKELKGRTLSVNEARPRAERPRGGGGGRNRGERY
jgi:RNA recognition motif-containing protein